MAADVRKEENGELESVSVFSDSRASQISDVSLESGYENEEIPSHAIVHQQMRDVLLVQSRIAQQQLRSNDEFFNASQRSLSSTVEQQKNKIKRLEHALQNDYVPKEDFIDVTEKLKEEHAKHKQTLAHLTTSLDKLDAAQKQASGLSLQLEQEKAACLKCCNSLNEDILELKAQNRELKSLITEKTQLYEELKSQASIQNEKIDKLKNKHMEQKKKLKQHVSESLVEKQQEAYLRQMENEDEKKSKKKK